MATILQEVEEEQVDGSTRIIEEQVMVQMYTAITMTRLAVLAINGEIMAPEEVVGFGLAWPQEA